jgi:hypothetical protein
MVPQNDFWEGNRETSSPLQQAVGAFGPPADDMAGAGLQSKQT